MYSIYTTHYSESDSVPCEGIYPIQVGRVLASEQLFPLVDSDGINISAKNPEYCELTAQYWVWKNKLDSEYIGFMHYRRHLSFIKNNKKIPNQWGLLEYDRIDDEYLTECGLCRNDIENCLSGFDIVVAEEWDVTNSGCKNNYDLYQNADFLHIEDYNTAIRVVNELYPEYSSAVSKYNSSKTGFYTNIFVMKKDIYNEYSTWLFNILNVVESKIDTSKYNTTEKRVIGHIAERLFGIYMYKVIEDGVYKVKSLQRTIVNNIDSNLQLPSPSFDGQNTPIILNFNDNYAKVAGALIRSITQFSSNDKSYDIFVLGNNLTSKNKNRLKELVKPFSNFSISYIDMNKFDLFKDIYVHAHFSKETYYRLYIPKIFSKFDKVIYIDADMIVQNDLNCLMHIDMLDHPVAAVQCYVMQMMMNDKVLSNLETGTLPADIYARNYLGMKNPSRYFQAGIIVMDINKLNELNFVKRAESLISDKDFWFLDQDIMNSIIDGDVALLPYNWNTLHGNNSDNTLDKKLPVELREKYVKAKNKPFIIHYAGDNKPWNNRHVYFSDVWWEQYAKTPWFIDEVLERMEVLESPTVGNFTHSIFFKLRNKIIKLINLLLPVGTRRRILFLKIYRRLRSLI